MTYQLELIDVAKKYNCSQRLELTTESKEETSQFLRTFPDLTFNEERHTRGHFNRGVK